MHCALVGDEIVLGRDAALGAQLLQEADGRLALQGRHLGRQGAQRLAAGGAGGCLGRHHRGRLHWSGLHLRKDKQTFIHFRDWISNFLS